MAEGTTSWLCSWVQIMLSILCYYSYYSILFSDNVIRKSVQNITVWVYYLEICSAWGLWSPWIFALRSPASTLKLMAFGFLSFFSALLVTMFTELLCTLAWGPRETLGAFPLCSSWGRCSWTSGSWAVPERISAPGCLDPGSWGFGSRSLESPASLSTLPCCLWSWRQSSRSGLSSDMNESLWHWYCMGPGLVFHLDSEWSITYCNKRSVWLHG